MGIYDSHHGFWYGAEVAGHSLARTDRCFCKQDRAAERIRSSVLIRHDLGVLALEPVRQENSVENPAERQGMAAKACRLNRYISQS